MYVCTIYNLSNTPLIKQVYAIPYIYTEKEKTKAQQLEQMAATLKHQLVLVSKDRDQKQARVEQLEEETHTFEDQLHKNQSKK